MRTLLIGSMAAWQYVPGYRAPKDIDVYADHEVPGAEVFWHPSFEEWLPDGTSRVATLDELYTIKVSHSAWDLGHGSWEKHMHDVALLKSAGALLDAEKFKMLYGVWEEQHGKKVVNLDQDKSMFFDDAVRRRYDHDSVHYSVAYGDKPLYESVFMPGAEIAMNMRAIKALPFDQQVRLFREEIYATALERWIIPSRYTESPRRAYAMALKKTVTSLTKGWSSRFIIENYDVFRRPDIAYVKHHKSKSHHLIPLEGK